MNFNFESLDNNNYSVDINRVLDSDAIYSVVKNFAKLYAERGYITPGDYFTNVSHSDLLYLREMVEGAHNGVFEDQENMILLSILMASAEGIDVTEEMIEKMFVSLALFVAIEFLDRNNLANAIRKNFTFDPTSNEVIARKI